MTPSFVKYYPTPSAVWCKTCEKFLYEDKYNEPIPVGEIHCPTCENNVG